MAEPNKKPLRQIARPFVADGPSAVSVRDRLKGLTTQDEKVLRRTWGASLRATWPAAAVTAWTTPPTPGPSESGR
jgi:hypothetical protein